MKTMLKAFALVALLVAVMVVPASAEPPEIYSVFAELEDRYGNPEGGTLKVQCYTADPQWKEDEAIDIGYAYAAEVIWTAYWYQGQYYDYRPEQDTWCRSQALNEDETYCSIIHWWKVYADGVYQTHKMVRPNGPINCAMFN